MCMKTAIVLAAALSGCVNIATNDPSPGSGVDAGKVYYLCVGMETSQRFGSCPGCKTDANRLSCLLTSKYKYSGDTLISDKATKEAVVEKLKAGIDKTPEDGLFLFLYSGHGGQEFLGGKEPDGSDREDEFLCLYDTYMMDDEIWDIVSKCRGRVFLYFDACHSATMYRSVAYDIGGLVSKKKGASALGLDQKALVRTKGFSFRPDKFATAHSMGVDDNRVSPRILCWSGCKESEYSYGSNSGGVLTTGLINGWKGGMSYGALWDQACEWVKSKEPTQHPVQTYVGNFPEGLEAFR